MTSQTPGNTSGFEQDGFLALEIDQVATEFEKRHTDLCRLYRDLNRRARTLLGAQAVSRELQPILCALYFGRILSVYEAVFLLGCRGLESETAMLMRGLVEAHFKFHYCGKSRENCRTLVLDEHERLRQLKNVQKHPSADQTAEQATDLQKLITETENELRTSNVKKISTKEMAVQTDRQWEYDLKYSHYCEPLHSSARSFMDSLRKSDDGAVDGLFWGPRHTEIPFNFAAAVDVLVEAILHPILGFPISPREASEWRQRSQAIFKLFKS